MNLNLKLTRFYRILYPLTAVLLFQAGISCAQNGIPVSAGDQIPAGKDYIWPGIFRVQDSILLIRFQNDGCFGCTPTGTGASIEKFDPQFHHLGNFPLSFDQEIDCKKPEPYAVYLVDTTLVFFVRDLNIHTRSYSSYILTAGISGRMPVRPVFLGEVKGIDIKKGNTVDFNPETYFSVSRFVSDTATRFLYVQRFPSVDQFTLKMMVKVLDEDLVTVRQKMLNLQYPPEYCELSEILLVNEELFFTLTYQDPFEEKMDKLVTYNFVKDEVAYYNFTLEGKKIHTIDLKMLSSGNIFLSGLYSEGTDEEDVDGIFFFLFDSRNQTLLMSASTSIGLPDDKTIRKEQLKNLRIRDVFTLPGNDLVLVSELFWTEVISFNDAEGKFYFKPLIHSDPILVLSFSGQGSPDWQTWIHRSMAQSEESLLGFKAFVSDTNLYLIYNDHPGNIAVEDPVQLKVARQKFIPILARIDTKTQKIDKMPLASQGKFKEAITFRKEYSIITNGNRLIMLDLNEYMRFIGFTFPGSALSDKK